MHEPMTLRRWMKRLRADLDLAQEAVAEQVGCAVQTIACFVIGKRRPSRELAERLAAARQGAPEQRSAFLDLARTAPAAGIGVGQGGAGRDPPAGTPAAAATMPQAARRPASSASGMALEHAPLLATKLYRPRPRAQLVPRPR